MSRLRAVLICLFLLLLASCASPSVVGPTENARPAAAQTSEPGSHLNPVSPTITSSPKSPSNPPPPSSTPEPKTSTATLIPISVDPQPDRISLLFTGVIVPARCVQAAIDERGEPDYPYDQVRDLITQADLAVGTLNATISDYPAHTGCVSTYVLVGGAENADALGRAGFDVMSVATNHIKNCGVSNCGDRAFYDTLDNLRRVGIEPVGAGANLAEAMQPVVLEVRGVRFGIVSLGQIEPMAFAGEASPGIAVLNEENLREAIATAREVSDVVIAMPHWGPEDVPTPNYLQRDLARVAVEAGADLVVGNHTHVVQAVQEIDEVMVFYGLGNFVFDQIWARDHQQGVILQAFFEGSRYAGYEFIPTHVDGDGTVHLAGEEEAAEILTRIEKAGTDLP
jgi:poly-gamma-glutamate capsule biosynthesis protein CapA/YwtB (metallophosphatase superfamily)